MIRSLIKKGNSRDAGNKIIAFINCIKGMENESIHLTSRLNALESEKLKGVIKHGDASIQLNELTMAAIYYCNKIEEQILEYFPDITITNVSISLEERISNRLRNKYQDIKKVIDGKRAAFYSATLKDSKRKVMLRVQKETGLNGSTEPLIDKEDLSKVMSIKHRNIIKVLNSDTSTYPHFLELEFINGRSVDHLITNSSFSLKRLITIFKQLVDAVYYLHINKISHKNIKPDKILIDNELIPVISPFDIASSSSNDDTAIRLDQLLYSSPELLKDHIAEGDYKSDQFSLGVVMYEMVSGHSLFSYSAGGDTQSKSMHDVIENRIRFFKSKKFRQGKINTLNAPRALKGIIAKMLSESPSDRYSNLKEVIADLEKIRIDTNAAIECAMDSYERCCISNVQFIDHFYDRLFDSPEYGAQIAAFFKSHNALKEDPKRFKMLRIAIDLLIHSKNEKSKILEVLNLPFHQGISSELFKHFVDILVAQIKLDDPLWEGAETRYLEESWGKIKHEFFSIIYELGHV